MPKISKKKSKTKRKIDKACKSKCKSSSMKFTGKDKKQFLKMCIASCSVDTKQFLLPKEQKIVPVKFNSGIKYDELMNLDNQKKVLLNNINSFAKSDISEHTLLWGAKGCGKSTLVKLAVEKVTASLLVFLVPT